MTSSALRPSSAAVLIAACALLLLPSAAWSRSGALGLAIEGELSCPSRELVLSSLVQRFGARHVTQRKGAAAAVLMLRAPGPDQLRVALQVGPAGPRFLRVLAVRKKECPELARTVVNLVDAWLQDIPWRGDPDLPAPPPRPPRPVEPAPEPAPPPPPEPPPVAPEPPTAEPAPVSSPPPAPAVEPPPAGPSEERRSWVPALLGGLAYDSGIRQAVIEVGAGIEYRFDPRWSAGLRLSYDAPAGAGAAPGQVSAWSSTLSVTGRRCLRCTGSSTVDLVAGLGLERMVAQSKGYTRDESLVLLGGKADVGVQLQGRLTGALAGVAGIGAQLRWPARDLAVAGVGTVMRLAQVRPFCTLGLIWDPK